MKNLRFFLIGLVFTTPLWWGANVLSIGFEDFFYTMDIATNPDFIAAQTAQANLFLQEKAARPILKSKSAAPEIFAGSALSIFQRQDGTTKILFGENETRPVPIASVTKLMTALIVLEEYDLLDRVEITSDSLNGEPDVANLKIGERFLLKDLLYPTLIESSNDAALALANFMGEKKFVAAMNAKAAELHLNDTRFVNPTGLDLQIPLRASNVSSAQDIAQLTGYLIHNHPEIFDILSQSSFTLYTADNVLHHHMENTNNLLTYPNWRDKPVGGKTGWTPLAKGSLVHVLFSDKSNGYIINVVLSSDDRVSDMITLVDWDYASYKW